MKKLFTLLASVLLLVAFDGNAQIFWTENFTVTSTGVEVGSFSSTNGAWSLAVTGTEGAESNLWYVSCMEAGQLAGTCGNICATGDLGASLHVGSSTIGDNGASYDAGGFCPILWCTETDRRAQSPTINCTGKFNIRLKFYYILNGQGTTDDGGVYYSPDNGVSWSLLVTPPKTTVCPSTQGRWDTLGVNLPVSADNNPLVKIGFRWVNNDDGVGSDPSFAVDSVSLRTPTGGGPGPIAASMTTSSTNVCEDSCITVTNTSTGTVDSARWSCPGATITSTSTSPATICFSGPAGTKVVKLYLYNGGVKVDSASTTITLKPAPNPVITKTGSTYSVPAVYSAYQWWTAIPPAPIAGATNATYTTTVAGTYAIAVDSAGCRAYTYYGATGFENIMGNDKGFWLSQQSNGTLDLHSSSAIDEQLSVGVYDATGRQLSADIWSKGSASIRLNDVSYPAGLYIVRLNNNNTATVLKWLKL